MTNEATEDTNEYVVVLNDEEQYSIWRADRPLPPGWRGDGTKGRKAECLAHIGKVWTDMRPLSVRRAAAAPLDPSVVPEPTTPRGGKNDLVARLEASQPIVFAGRSEATREELGAQVERGRVFVRFEKTGTDLGIRLSATAHAAARHILASNGESIAIEGELILNYNRVRFIGALELATLRGTGKLEYLGETTTS